jgi:cell division protein FtsW
MTSTVLPFRARKEHVVPRSGTYLLLVSTIVVLNVIGVVMVLSASSVVSIRSQGSAWYYFQRQLVWTVLGAVGFAVVQGIDYRRWRQIARPLLIVAVALLVLVLVPHVGIRAGGSQRWLGVGAWRFQPTELAKLALALFAADVLTRRVDEIADWRRVLRPVLGVLAGVAVLVMLEPDLDTTLLLGLIVGSILLVGGVRAKHLAVVGGVGVMAVGMLAISAPYRLARVQTLFTGGTEAAGWQIKQSLIALGTGGIDGVGLGAGSAKWSFLPNAHTDFIFAVIGEEMGLIGTLMLIGLFGVFAALGIRTAMHAPDRFGMLLATGVTVWVIAQAFVNVGGVIGILPVSGIPLPFVSFGGSSLVFTMIAAGLLTSVARRIP